MLQLHEVVNEHSQNSARDSAQTQSPRTCRGNPKRLGDLPILRRLPRQVRRKGKGLSGWRRTGADISEEGTELQSGTKDPNRDRKEDLASVGELSLRASKQIVWRLIRNTATTVSTGGI